MNITESLKLQADLQAQIDQIQSRLLSCVRVEKGSKPLEKPENFYKLQDTLLKRLGTAYSQMERAIYHAAYKDKSLIEMLSEQKILTLQIKLMKETLNKANELTSLEGVCYEPTIDIKLLEKQLFTLEELKRDIDSKIQSLFQITKV